MIFYRQNIQYMQKLNCPHGAQTKAFAQSDSTNTAKAEHPVDWLITLIKQNRCGN